MSSAYNFQQKEKKKNSKQTFGSFHIPMISLINSLHHFYVGSLIVEQFDSNEERDMELSIQFDTSFCPEKRILRERIKIIVYDCFQLQSDGNALTLQLFIHETHHSGAWIESYLRNMEKAFNLDCRWRRPKNSNYSEKIHSENVTATHNISSM